ncbi:class I SAM-dependent methyltransferase [Ruegeria sp. 2205SS24-7]|uniref:class I SAM-dependent methyltransferase n=1 Tax=Ruegeria discodermiae TaxID=3064389 RepID=UPI0027416C7E|nr:class I SAM-dependent methyltransferase [Ruegeria sp. 2205SS24-7]MDP5216717.1 class I SAM-dependent methyltransferase [Ruegeria sp. 2205SS24-7]
MGKRSSFDRIPRDAYDTPLEAVLPIIPQLPDSFWAWEPCAGRGQLIEHIMDNHDGAILCGSDIEPRAAWVFQRDALEVENSKADLIITNPPWDRKVLHPMIEHFSAMCPTWLLFDADWVHTKQSAPYIKWLRKIVSVGRVKWIPDSPYTGKDNCCWYLFDQKDTGPTEFVGRSIPTPAHTGGTA